MKKNDTFVLGLQVFPIILFKSNVSLLTQQKIRKGHEKHCYHHGRLLQRI